MAFLPSKSIHALVRAACAVRLDEEALVDSLPPHVRSSLRLGSSAASRLLVVLNELNYWQPQLGEEPPLCVFLRNAAFLATGRAEATVFDDALAEVEQLLERGARQAKTSRQLHDLLMKRAKRFFTSHGFEVMPPEAEPSATFLAYRGTGIVMAVAVADQTVEEAIASVTHLVEEVQPNEPLALGYVVLPTGTPAQQRSDEAKVRAANLKPLPYGELSPVGMMEIETFASRQHAWLLAEPDPPELGEADMTDDPLEDWLRDLLRESETRVLFLRFANRRAVWHAQKRLAHACSQDFTNKPDAPAPLVLPVREQPPATLEELVAEAFRFHDVRFSPLALVQLLESGVLLPIFAATDGVSSRAGWPLVQRSLHGRAKAVLLGCEGDDAPTPSLARRLNMPATGVRAITARRRPPRLTMS